MDTVQSERNGSMDKDKRTRLLRLASDLLNNSNTIHFRFACFPLPYLFVCIVDPWTNWQLVLFMLWHDGFPQPTSILSCALL